MDNVLNLGMEKLKQCYRDFYQAQNVQIYRNLKWGDVMVEGWKY